ncbi:MAG: gliding motility-associated C-terminal domain-containing protein [Flavobacteriales bacterium]|nr:gliding motility-associated C-terminal domain-containing protein [Flavobacteriales bacterium]
MGTRAFIWRALHHRKSFAFFVCWCLLSFSVFGQRGKDGTRSVTTPNTIVNEFTALTADASTGDLIINVLNSGLNANGRFNAPLAAGDLVMIIQMQGATIDGSPNDSTWGRILSYNNCGNYEFKEVLDVPSSTTIEFSCPLAHDYTASGRVQVIRVPRFNNLTVTNNSVLTTQNWNGTTGGVLVVEALNNIVINNGGLVDASGRGFRGGQLDNQTNYNITDFASTNNQYGGEKGEGIAGFQADYNAYGGRYGRGAPANGGGGGNAHNAGGGGGANANILMAYTGNGNPDPGSGASPWTAAWDLEYPGFSASTSSGGGRGGYTYSSQDRNATSVPPGNTAWGGDNRHNVGGKGGRPLDYTLGRLFMGGGGGAGDGNNNASNAGANGGGIIYFLGYSTLNGNSTGQIRSDGQTALNTISGGNDAPGGGGGGGTIILNTTQLISGGVVTVNGGAGGNQIITCCGNEGEGPGGGGGGGYIGLTTTDGSTVMQVTGGANGVSDSRGVTEFLPNGATAGGPGILDTIYPYDVNIEAINDTICIGSTADLVAMLTGNPDPQMILVWYDLIAGGNVLQTGPNFSVGPLFNDTVFYVGTCPETYRIPVYVTVNPEPQINLTNDNSDCKNVNDGSITSVTLGGTAPFTYTWSSGHTQANITGLSPGTYSVTVTDSEGCTGTNSTTISEPTFLIATIVSSTDATCTGGSATVSVTGGTPPYTYDWSPTGGTQPTASNLPPGNYLVIVTDSNGCQALANVTIGQVSALTGTISGTNVTCNGSNNGTAVITPSGGILPYQYLWSNGATQSNVGGLAPGTFNVTVTDSAGCTLTRTVSITQPPTLNVGVQSKQNAYCGGANGNITMVASGGAGPYTYLWTPGGETTISITGLGPGTYSFTVTDNNGCTASRSVGIVLTPMVTASHTSTDANCNLGSDGTISLTVSGGQTPYTYSWVPGGYTTANVTGLSAGTYYVTATDAWGCSVVDSTTISEPSAMILTGSKNDATCGSSNGQVSISASGGNPGYTYLWSPGNYTTATVTGLSAGAYMVTVTDNTGCDITSSVVVNNITGPTLGLSSTDVYCNGSNTGSITVTPSGGTPPFTYLWAPGGYTSASISGLSAGTYAVTVTDNNTCLASQVVEIMEPTALDATLSMTPLSCKSSGDGTATVTAYGGTPGYNYLWFDGTTNATATGLSAGSHSVTVTDNNGCPMPFSVTVTEPDTITGTVSVTDATCNGGSDGTALVNASGGISPYSFNWSPLGGSDSLAIGLPAGTYTVTVRDSNGCSIQLTGDVSEAPAMTGTITSNIGVSCTGGNDGTLTITPGGGSPGYQYLWSPSGATTATATGLSVGIHFVTVTDTYMCPLYLNDIIQEPDQLQGTAIEAGPTYCGQSLGSARAEVTGGTGPYTYLWAPSGATTLKATGLPSGVHYLTVTDNNGCTSVDSVTIQDMPGPTVVIDTVTNVSCFGGSNGSATIVASGGTAPYTYTWSPAGPSYPTMTGMTAGQFYFTVTDANGCSVSDSGMVTEPPVLSGSIDAITPPSCHEASDGSISVSASGGTTPYGYVWNTTPVQYNPSLNNLPANYYQVTVTDANGCKVVMDTTVIDPGNIVGVTGVVSHVTCDGGNNGIASVTATGGTSPYTYLWDVNGQVTDTVGNLSAGTYHVTITDVNGCTDTTSVIVNENDPVITLATDPGAVCPGDTVKISAVATGGGSDLYYFIWSHGLDSDSVQYVTPTVTTTYIVRAEDEFGCTGTPDSITVNMLTLDSALLTLNSGMTICDGDSTTVLANVTGIADSITYSWSPNVGTGPGPFTVIPDTTTTYVVTVANQCGATIEDSVTIEVKQLPLVFFLDPDTGCVPLDVTFNTQISSPGDTVVSWLWDFGDGSIDTTAVPVHTYDLPGTFYPSLTLSLSSGCTFTFDDTNGILVYDLPQADFTTNPDPGVIFDPIQFIDLSTDATYWLWTFGDPNYSYSNLQNPTFVYLDSGNYEITLLVENMYGCTDTITRWLEVKPRYYLYVPNVFSPNGDHKNEYFFPVGENIDPQNFVMYIFDRWGNEIFQTTSIQGWDGTANEGSEIQQEDVYVWLILSSDAEGRPIRLMGHVTLIK